MDTFKFDLNKIQIRDSIFKAATFFLLVLFFFFFKLS